MVLQLEDEGFLEQVGETKKYRVGYMAYELGVAAMGELRIPSRVHLQHMSYIKV